MRSGSRLVAKRWEENFLQFFASFGSGLGSYSQQLWALLLEIEVKYAYRDDYLLHRNDA